MRKSLYQFALILSLSAQVLGQDEASPAANPLETCRTLLEKGDALAALHLVEQTAISDTQQFWKARVLIELGRTQEAAPILQKIPQGSKLFPYAAKALIFCAWQDKSLDFDSLIKPLTRCNNPAIVRISKAALLEHMLENQGDLNQIKSLYAELLSDKQEDDISQTLPLLYIDILCREKKFQEALQLSHDIEQNIATKYPSHVRELSQLKLAKVYYAQHDEQNPQQAKNPAEIDANNIQQDDLLDESILPEEGHSRETILGQGEETLLNFISIYPESTLVPLAIKELKRHGAFDQTNYARNRFREWMKETGMNKKQRSAYSLFIFNDIRRLQGRKNDLSYINTAMSQFPREHASHQLLLEAVRDCIDKGLINTAERYLKLYPKKDAYSLFLEASIVFAKGDKRSASLLFQQSSAQCQGKLRELAIENAFICALDMDDKPLEDRILKEATTKSLTSSLLLLRSSKHIESARKQAQIDALKVIELQASVKNQIDAQLNLIQISLSYSAQQALKELRALRKSSKSVWSKQQNRRYYALLIEAVKRIDVKNKNNKEILLKTLNSALMHNTDEQLHQTLSFQLGHALFEMKRYKQAYETYLKLGDHSKNYNIKARAYLLAATSAEDLNTLPALKNAIRLYEKCQALEGPLSTLALLKRALVELRIGHEDKAIALITPRLKENNVSPNNQLLAHSVLADAYAIKACRDEKFEKTALENSRAMLSIEGLETNWMNRAHLQHAVLSARFGNHADALKHYNIILEQIRKNKLNLTQAQRHSAYFAGSGAVSGLLELKRPREAASLAEEIADWQISGSEDKFAYSLSELQNNFNEWGAYIRKTHFLNTELKVQQH